MPTYTFMGASAPAKFAPAAPATIRTTGGLRLSVKADGADALLTATDELPIKILNGPDKGPLRIEVRITRQKITLATFGFSGLGLLAVRSVPTYVNSKLREPVEAFLSERAGKPVSLGKFTFSNAHFAPRFWGQDITTKSATAAKERTRLRFSSPRMSELEEKYPFLQEYFSQGTVRSISGRHADLSRFDKESRRRDLGHFTFERAGVLKCDFFDTALVTEFARKLAVKGFFSMEEGP